MMAKKKFGSAADGGVGSDNKYANYEYIPRMITPEEYYCRWGYLPPGYEVKLSNGTKIVGGCDKWRAHADRMGYENTRRFLDKIHRPWEHGDEPIGGKQDRPKDGLDLYKHDINRTDYLARKLLMGRTARAEAVTSCNDWLRKAGVDHLEPTHPARREALVAWGKWFRGQPNTSMAKNDPNRLGPPKGWKGVV